MRISELRQQPVRRFTTSRGDVVETYLTDEQAVKLMSKEQDKLSNFGFGLVEQVFTKRGLSEKQWPWFHKLALELLPEAARPSYQPKRPEGLVIETKAVRDLMDRASQHLKFPKIRFTLEQGKVQIARAGSGSRTPGAIMVTDGGPFGANVFYGRIHLDGRWEAARTGCPQWVTEALVALAKDPAGYAGIYGQRTGNCCFCGRDLTDGRSVAVGYGPICADHYGLPWGEVTVAEEPLHLPEESVPEPVKPWQDVTVEKQSVAPWSR